MKVLALSALLLSRLALANSITVDQNIPMGSKQAFDVKKGDISHRIEVQKVPFSYGSEEADLQFLVEKLNQVIGQVGTPVVLNPPETRCNTCINPTSTQARARLTLSEVPNLPQQNNPLKIFGLQMPLNLKSEPSHTMRLSINSGNTFIVPVTLNCKTGNCSREMSLDFVGDKLSLDYSRPLKSNPNQELGVSLSAFVLNKGNEATNPFHYVVSDRFIEDYHSTVLGQNDNYNRRATGFNKFSAVLKDRNGNNLELNEGQPFALPLELRLTQYTPLVETSEWNASANASLHGGVPLNLDTKDSFSVGISAGLQATHKTGKLWSTTYAAGGSVADQEIGHFKKNSYQHYDESYQWAFTFLIGFNRRDENTSETKPGNSTHYFISTRSTSATFDKKLYSENPSDTIHQVRGKNAGTDGTHFFTIGALRVIRNASGNKTTIQLSCNDDFDPGLVFIGKKLGGNNGEDFGCGLSVQQGF